MNEHQDVNESVGLLETLDQGRRVKGAWNRAQFALLGIAWPPIKGWKAELIRQNFRLSRERHDEFVALRSAD